MAKPNLAALAAKIAPASPAPAPTPAPAPETTPAPEPTPAPGRQPTQDSLPKLGPVLAPMPTPTAKAPTPAGLSPAQRAALTRRANQQANGTAPAKAGATPAPAQQARPDGLELVLAITEGERIISVSFRWERNGELAGHLAPAPERAVNQLAVNAHAVRGELFGHNEVTLRAPALTVSGMEAVLPTMRRINRAIEVTHAESEDPSFAQTVLVLATHLRVSRIEAVANDRTVTTAKRGAAYITAHKAGEAFLARVAKPAPEATPAPEASA